MTKHIIHLLSILTIILSSCSKDWLDKKPSQDIAKPSTLKDFQALLDNSNSGYYGSMNINSPALGQLASDESYITDASFNARADIEKNAFTWDNKMPYRKISDWILSYERVAVCNIVIEGLREIPSLSSADQIEFNSILGQSLFQRSKAFYELAQIWAPPYISGEKNDALGIPLRLQSDINIPSKRYTVDATYKQIVDDLLEAKEILPLYSTQKTRASKIASFALLARVFLCMGLYENAGQYADSCLQKYSQLVDYNHLMVTSSFPIPLFNSEIIFHSTLLSWSTIGTQARIESDFRNLYSDNDLRKKFFFGTSGGLITFKGNYTGSSTRFSGLAVDEQYLIRAECYARAGKVQEAMADLNMLYRNRWDSNEAYIDLTALDAEDALRQVLLERRKELLLRGLRWSDLRRLNRDPRFAETLTRTVNGETYTLEPNSYKYTFPIPDDIIQMTGFQQNPGWDN